jgi:hypothetical protein
MRTHLSIPPEREETMSTHIVPSIVAGLLVVSFAAVPTFAVTLAVPGTSDPWLAGMPDGSTASLIDVAPAQSPVLVTGFNLSLGIPLTFSASGAVSNGGCCPFEGPDGGSIESHLTGAENGIANITAPINSLVGVFLDASQPNTSPAPATLDFTSIGVSFTSLAPGLKQVFFIGDGLTGTGSGTVQTVLIPDGATRLFLGTMDGFEWQNNIGAFTVTVAAVPEPGTLLLFAVGLTAAGIVRRRLTKGRSLTG